MEIFYVLQVAGREFTCNMIFFYTYNIPPSADKCISYCIFMTATTTSLKGMRQSQLCSPSLFSALQASCE